MWRQARKTSKPEGAGGHRGLSSSLGWHGCYELIGTLTGDDIKSLAGLCDVSVVKGRTNFLRMRTFITEVSKHAGSDEAEVAALLKRVDETENFLRIGASACALLWRPC